MDQDLTDIKQSFNDLKNRRIRLFLKVGTFLLVLGSIGLHLTFAPEPLGELTCRISTEQKNLLKTKILEISACGKTSRIAVYKALKAHFKYDTIGKMPCDQFDEAQKLLNKTKLRFCD